MGNHLIFQRYIKFQMDGAPADTDGGAKNTAETVYATCIMNPDGDSTTSGVVKLVQEPGQMTKITAEIKNLTPGEHGFHIHQFGNLIEGCKTAGPHYNPHGKTHGGPNSEIRHVGDLGNVEANAEGVAHYELEDHQVMLHGEFSV